MTALTVLLFAGVVGTIFLRVAMLALFGILSCGVSRDRDRYLEVDLKSMTLKYGDVRNDRHGAAR